MIQNVTGSFHVGRQLDTLFSLPASVMAGDLFIVVIDRQCLIVSLGDNLLADKTGWHGVAVGVKAD